MRGIKVATLGLAGATLVVALVAGLMTSVSAASHGIDIHDGTAAPGAEVSVDVGAHGITEGLGSWGLNVLYDDSVVSVASCSGISVCNPAFTTDDGDAAVRIVGADPNGLVGDTVLATITFLCGDSEGTSALTLEVGLLADATIGDPQDITGITAVSDGTITCEEAADEPMDDEPMDDEPMDDEPDLPATGISGSTGGGNGLSLLIAGLAAAGLAAIAGFGALRLSARRQ